MGLQDSEEGEEIMPLVKVGGKTKKIKYGNKKPMRKPKGK